MLYPWLESYYQQFVQSVAQGRMNNSLIIAGSQGLGVNALALEIVKYYLCHNRQSDTYCGQCRSCLSFNSFNHQDLMVAYTSNAEEAKSGADFTTDCSGLIARKESKTRRSMRIDTMRKITDFLNESAVMGKGKAVIICGADLMNEAAANAILKTFEEPLPNTLIVMLTKSLESLLPTILSRASKMVVRDIDHSIAEQFILDPRNQVPMLTMANADIDTDLSSADRQAAFQQYEEDAISNCEGLKTPIDKKRADVALALNSYAPLDAMNMLLSGEDIKALRVVELFADKVKRRQDDDIEVINSLKQLNPVLRSRLLYELVLETLKFKARVPIETLPLIYYPNAVELQYLQADHLLDACNKLRFIEDRLPLIPSMAPVALLRSWLIGLNRRKR